MRTTLTIAASLLMLFIVGIATAILWPTRAPPPSMASINKPFSAVDFSTLAPVSKHKARDGETIAYRLYPSSEAKAVALLLHGSSAHARSMHPLAKSLAENGITAYAIDIRGHGQTGRRGDVDYIGQPAHDVADILALITAKHPNLKISLLGFSLGGGLALMAAGNGHAKGIAKLVLIAPMLGHDQLPSTTKNPFRSKKERWAYPRIPRIIGLSILNGFGIHWFDHLHVIQYAVDKGKGLTGQYSHRLLMSVHPQNANDLIKATKVPISILVGEQDELFTAPAYAKMVHPVRADVPIRIVPGLNHIGITLQPRGHEAIAESILKPTE